MRCGAVYNTVGGRANLCSILEVFSRVEALSGKPMRWEYAEEARAGDHICCISNLRKIRQHYPGWEVSASLERLLTEIVKPWWKRAI